MFHPRIIRHYSYRVTECNTYAADALVDTALFYDIPQFELAQFLCTIGAIGSRRFARWFEE